MKWITSPLSFTLCSRFGIDHPSPPHTRPLPLQPVTDPCGQEVHVLNNNVNHFNENVFDILQLHLLYIFTSSNDTKCGKYLQSTFNEMLMGSLSPLHSQSLILAQQVKSQEIIQGRKYVHKLSAPCLGPFLKPILSGCQCVYLSALKPNLNLLTCALEVGCSFVSDLLKPDYSSLCHGSSCELGHRRPWS